jgi:hypothetical protein
MSFFIYNFNENYISFMVFFLYLNPGIEKFTWIPINPVEPGLFTKK